MEIPVGLSMLQEVYRFLPPASAVPASIAVRPAALLPEFLVRFRRQFPASAETLFPGFFTNDSYHPFTERGESLITASICQSFPPLDTPRPYDSLSAWIGNLLDLSHTAAAPLFEQYEYPWEVLPHISAFILELGKEPRWN